MPDDAPLVPGRSCDRCTLCCKVMRVQELAKPKSTWCPHCAIGKGCTIYETRPEECRGFFCGYRRWSEVGEHWFPADSKMLLSPELDGTRIGIHVDPGSPSAWRKEPYLSEIRKMAAAAFQRGHYVVVIVGHRAIVVFPDREVDLGTLGPDETILTTVARRPGDNAVIRMSAEKRKLDDPDIAGA